MDTKTKIFWWVIGFLILASFGATYYRYMVKKDYIVQAQVDCDPYSETCFVWNCDLESEEEGEMCTGDPEVGTWYYKVINKNANQISSCDASDENCDALVCAQNEPNCEFVFCNEENREEYYSETCTNPEEYTQANPVEEECEEGDEECLAGEDLDEDLSEEEIMIQTTDDEILAEDNESVGEGEEPAGELPIAE